MILAVPISLVGLVAMMALGAWLDRPDAPWHQVEGQRSQTAAA